MSMCISIAQAPQTVRPDLGARHFSCEFLHKIAHVTSPCAFRLRKLAQTVRHDPWPRLA
jgi:hypothetical protein